MLLFSKSIGKSIQNSSKTIKGKARQLNIKKIFKLFQLRIFATAFFNCVILTNKKGKKKTFLHITHTLHTCEFLRLYAMCQCMHARTHF